MEFRRARGREEMSDAKHAGAEGARPKRRSPSLLRIALALLILPIVAFYVLAWVSRSRPELGLDGGRLRALSERPNGVSSLASDASQRVDAIALDGQESKPIERLKAILAARARTTLLEETPDYLHYECRSAIFGFCDDLEFHLRPAEGRIDVRAAARVGYSDLGANRARVEEILQTWKRAKGS